MRHFMGRTRFNLAMWASTITSVVTGAILNWLDSDGFSTAWMRSGPGIGFGVATGFALLALIVDMNAQRHIPDPDNYRDGDCQIFEILENSS
jgi:hypothetical protein